MPVYALVINGAVTERRTYPSKPADIPHKQVNWLPVEVVGNDAFDPRTHKKTGPVTTIEAARVLDTYSIVVLTAQEISDKKDEAINDLNNVNYSVLYMALLALENDNRLIKAKLNALIDATNMAGTVTKFTAGQAAQITMAQLKTGFKALL